MNRNEFVDRFLAMSMLYLDLLDSGTADFSLEEFCELLEAVNDERGPLLSPDRHIA